MCDEKMNSLKMFPMPCLFNVTEDLINSNTSTIFYVNLDSKLVWQFPFPIYFLFLDTEKKICDLFIDIHLLEKL